MVIAVALIGWIAGVLVNYVSDVLPKSRKLVFPSCRMCGEKFEILNYLFFPRKCHRCHTYRTMRSWIVEIATPISVIYLWINPAEKLGFLLSLLLLIYFFIVIVIDIEHRLILHPVSILGAVIGTGSGIISHGFLMTILGGIIGFGAMYLLYQFGILFTKFVIHRQQRCIDEEALGFGDVILSGVLGLILGWPGIILGLMLAILAGGLVSLFYILFTALAGRYRAFSYIPYGPFLVLGSGALLFFSRYLSQIFSH